MAIFQGSQQARKHFWCGAIWGLVEQWFPRLPVPCRYLPVWLHKNALHHLLKMLVPGVLFQSFPPWNMCFSSFPRWLWAHLCLRATGRECCASSRMFWSIKCVKLAAECLNSFMRQRLLFWILSLVVNPWGLPMGSGVLCLSKKNVSGFLTGQKDALILVLLLFWLFSIFDTHLIPLIPMSWWFPSACYICTYLFIFIF